MTGSTQSGAPQPCQALCAQLSGYLDGEVAAEVCAAIDAHLATCPDCRVVVNTLDRTVRLYRSLACRGAAHRGRSAALCRVGSARTPVMIPRL